MKYILFLPMVLLFACSHSKKLTTQSNELYQKWVLVDLNGSEITGENAGKVTIEFNKDESRVAGKAACNNYFGGFELSGNKLTFKPLGSTQMYCGDETMKLESNYFKMIEQVAHYQIADNQLIFSDKDGESIATFKLSE